MQRDNFLNVLYRLVNLLENAQTDLETQIKHDLSDLKICLEMNLTNYIADLRDLLSHINNCYQREIILGVTTKQIRNDVVLDKTNIDDDCKKQVIETLNNLFN